MVGVGGEIDTARLGRCSKDERIAVLGGRIRQDQIKNETGNGRSVPTNSETLPRSAPALSTERESLEDEWGHVPTVEELEESVNSWIQHVCTCDLQERKDFAGWLLARGPAYLAWAIDAEIPRHEMYQVYLKDRFGE